METPPELQTLLEDVRYLRDRLEIMDVIALYCRGLDRLDSQALTRAYHADAIDRHGPFLGDRDTFVDWAIELVAEFPVSHHSVTTHNCEVKGDKAWAESYCVFFTVMPDRKKIGAGAARYIDELERRDGTWAITKRVEVMDCCYELEPSSWLGPAWEEIPPRQDRTDLSYARPLDIPEPNS